MSTKLLCNNHKIIIHNGPNPNPTSSLTPPSLSTKRGSNFTCNPNPTTIHWQLPKRRSQVVAVSAGMQPLDLTEENVETVLVDARAELAQLFDLSVGITGQAELAELDGPYVTIRLKGKFWHTRAMVLARLENYLKQRIPEILQVDIEDEKMLDDSPANF